MKGLIASVFRLFVINEKLLCAWVKTSMDLHCLHVQRDIILFIYLKMTHVSWSFLKIHIVEETSLVTYF